MVVSALPLFPNGDFLVMFMEHHHHLLVKSGNYSSIINNNRTLICQSPPVVSHVLLSHVCSFTGWFRQSDG